MMLNALGGSSFHQSTDSALPLVRGYPPDLALCDFWLFPEVKVTKKMTMKDVSQNPKVTLFPEDKGSGEVA